MEHWTSQLMEQCTPLLLELWGRGARAVMATESMEATRPLMWWWQRAEEEVVIGIGGERMEEVEEEVAIQGMKTNQVEQSS